MSKYIAYQNWKEISQNDDYAVIKSTVLDFAHKNVNAFFSIRENGMSSYLPALFTAKFFNEKSLESIWYSEDSSLHLSSGLHTTEVFDKTIKFTIILF